MIYLASPYSHPLRVERRRRFEVACQAAAILMKRGLHVFSPIAHSHPIAEYGLDALSHEFWMDQDREYLEWCSSMIVLKLGGWKTSKGVQEEIWIMTEMGKPIEYMSMADVLGVAK